MQLLLTGDLDAAEQAEWAQALRAALPAHTLHLHRSDAPDPAAIAVAIVANPPPGSLAGLPGLRLIQSLWAGVDRLLGDATLPVGVPLARMVDPAMNAAMAETALWAVLSLQRGFFTYAQQQQQSLWQQHPQARAADCPVLVLGHGQMGQAVSAALARQGFAVTAWRRAGAGPVAVASAPTPTPTPTPTPPHPLPADGAAGAVTVISGLGALAAARGRAPVVVNLLPLTADTRGLINAAWLAAMAPGAALVNLARGAHVVEADLLAALASGQLSHAVLDVFQTEPLPAGHAFWQHPQVTVLPHAAAMTDARSAAAVVARNIDALASGRPIAHLVARQAGY